MDLPAFGNPIIPISATNLSSILSDEQQEALSRLSNQISQFDNESALETISKIASAERINLASKK